MMRVMDREATINPSAVEEKARKAMAQRQDAHEKANQERKLTPEERRAKKRKKLQENTDYEVTVALFRYVNSGFTTLPQGGAARFVW